MLSDTRILTDAQLAEIEARANAATAPPWEYISGCTYTQDGPEPEHPDYLQSADGNLTLEIAGLPACGCCPNLTFIAHARADVPALIASHRAQGEEITRLREDLATYGRHMPGCNGQWPNYKCDCGWDQTRAALDTATRGEDGKNV